MGALEQGGRVCVQSVDSESREITHQEIGVTRVEAVKVIRIQERSQGVAALLYPGDKVVSP